MTIEQLLASLNKKNIKLKLDAQDNIVIRGDKQALDAGQIAQIKANKPAIVAFLQKFGVAEKAVKIPPRDNPEQAGVLSFQQQRLWFIDQFGEGSAQYNIFAALELTGELDIDALNAGFNQILSRHQVLRTTYVESETAVETKLNPATQITVNHFDYSGQSTDEQNRLAQQLVADAATHQFNLAEDLMVKVDLAKLDKQHYLLVLTIAHIAADGLSINVLIKEFAELYQAYHQNQSANLDELAIQYADYAAWQRKTDDDGGFDKALAYWREQLDGIPKIHNLPTKGVRPVAQTFNGVAFQTKLDKQTHNDIEALCTEHNATLYMFLHSCLALLIGRYSNESDIVIGTPVSGRSSQELNGLIGCFINTLVVRSDLAKDLSFTELLLKNRETLLDAYKHQDLPFDKLVEELKPERSLSYNPMFQTLLNLQNYASDELSLSDLTITQVPPSKVSAKVDLEVTVTTTTDGLSVQWLYNSDIFSESMLRQFAASFEVLVKSALNQPKINIGALPLLSDAQKQHIFSHYNSAATEPAPSLCIQELFCDTVKAMPNACALIDQAGEMSYLELWQHVFVVAEKLKQDGLAVEQLVSVRMQKGRNQVIATLAVMMAGGAYLPLERSWPQERCAKIAGRAGLKLNLSDGEAGALNCSDVTDWNMVQWLDTQKDLLPQSYIAAETLQKPDDLAYVIFTSGSTGEPKGVAIEHQSAVNTLLDINERFEVTKNDRILAVSALSFDLSVYDFFGLFAAGGTAVIPNDEDAKDPRHWLELVERHQVTLWDTVPVSAALLVEQLELEQRQSTTNLRHVLMSGDWIAPTLPKRLWQRFENCRVNSLGGATEGSIWSIHYPIEKDTSALKSIPYGKPLKNQAFYILDENLQAVPPGVKGELFIGGVGVAREYYGSPDITAQRFIRHPELDAMLYRTGDNGRYMADGNIEFMGRVDHQVKVQGYRIELGEIEHQLAELPSIKSAVVVARDEPKRLVAYLVATEQGISEAVLFEQAQEQVRKTLPDYMMPSSFIMLDKLPLSSNGKVDVKALPEPQKRNLTETYVAPNNEIESQLVEIWSELLSLPVQSISTKANFFDLGGHSLLAGRVMTAIAKQLQQHLPIRVLFECPDIQSLAKRLQQASDVVQASTIVPLPLDAKKPLSYAQQRLWFIHHLQPDSTEFNMVSAMRLTARLDSKLIGETFKRILQRHQVLSTIYTMDENDEPVAQRIDCNGFEVAIADLSNLSQEQAEAAVVNVQQAQAGAAFDLSRDLMLRVNLLEMPKAQQVMIVTVHHIASDGWSQSLLMSEFCRIYQSLVAGSEPELPQLDVQYSDYAKWQRDNLDDTAIDKQLAFWQDKLAGIAPVHSLPLDRPRPAERSFEGALYRKTLDKDLSSALNAFAKSHDVTLFMVLNSAFSVLLGRYSRNDDIVLGTTVANRDSAQVSDMLGLFINTLVLRSRLDDNPNVATLLQCTKDYHLDAYQNKDLPFEKLVESMQDERDLNLSPLFQIMLVMQNNAQSSAAIDGVEITPIDQSVVVSKFDLTLYATEMNGVLNLDWEFATALFDKQSIEQMAEHFEVLIRQMLANPGAKVKSLPLVTEQLKPLERQSTTKSNVEPCLLLSRFAQHVAQNPEQTAAIFGQIGLSYRQLDEKSNRLAECLHEMDLETGARVGIHLPASIEMLIAVLGALKAGLTYVPLDSRLPSERLAFVLSDAEVELVMVNDALMAGLPNAGVDVLLLDDAGQDDNWFDEYDGDYQTDIPAGDSLAYMIYTSGSTGNPKGVQISHQALSNYLSYACQTYDNETLAGSVVSSPLGFDATITTLLSPLCFGKSVEILPDDGTELVMLEERLFKTEQSLLFKLTPSHLQALSTANSTSANHTSCHQIVVGGEAFGMDTLRHWKGQRLTAAHFYNEYGPTETTVGCSSFCVKAVEQLETIESHSVPIGFAIEGVKLYVLDDQMQPLPANAVGELYIGGAGLSQGYQNLPEETAKRFVDNPFVHGEKLYRSGDLVRLYNDGNLDYLGRIDTQVKLSGVRIELEEIESLINTVAGVSACVVIADAEANTLRGYVVADMTSDQAGLVSSIEQHLQAQLPAYMLPGSLQVLDALPLTVNGKVDVKALPKPQDEGQSDIIQLPADELELQLCGLYAQVLGLEQVDTNSSFFSLGGDSIGAMILVSKAAKAGLGINIKDIYDHKTVAGLKPYVEQKLSNIDQAEVVGSAKLLPVQKAFLEAGRENPEHYNQSVLLSVPAEFDITALKQIVPALYRRHDALRQRFICNEGVWQVDYQPLDEQTLSTAVKSHSCALEQVHLHCDAIQKSMVLDSGLLLKSGLFDLTNGEKQLFIAVHHLAVDAVSWQVMLMDLQLAWQQYSQGQKIKLESKTHAYRDWGDAVFELAEQASTQQQVDYWKAQLGQEHANLKGLWQNQQSAEIERKVLSKKLSDEQTGMLLAECNELYNTSTLELLLSGLVLAHQQVNDSKQLRVTLEGHGRELSEKLLVTDTVGWFTSIYPLLLTIEQDEHTGEVIKTIKETYRAIPDKGIGFGALDAHLDAFDQFKGVTGQELLFNYLGQLDNALSVPQGQAQSFAPTAGDKGSEQALERNINHPLEMNLYVAQGALTIDCICYQGLHDIDAVQGFIANFKQQLEEIVSHCLAMNMVLQKQSVAPIEHDDELELETFDI